MTAKAKMEVGARTKLWSPTSLHIVERYCAPEPINVHYVMIFFDICIPLTPGKNKFFWKHQIKMQ